MHNSIVSIIIPVFNRPTLVTEAIDSVLAQTNPNWELIVVDDCSTDNTWEVLESYAAKDERIRIYKRDSEPKGANRCRNMGAEKARVDYLFFLDSDDLIGETFVETRKKYIELYPEMDFIVFPEATFENSPKEGYYYARKLFREEGDLVRFFKWDNPWLTSGPIIKKICFFQVYGFNEKLLSGQEWDLFVRILMQEKKYFKVPMLDNPDVFKRSSPEIETISNSNSFQKRFLDKQKSFENIKPLLIEKRLMRRVSPLRKTIIQYYFLMCIKLIEIGNHSDANKFWDNLYKVRFVNTSEWLYWRFYFLVKAKNHFLIKKTMEFFAFRLANSVYYFN